jgi:hypothetical protein
MARSTRSCLPRQFVTSVGYIHSLISRGLPQSYIAQPIGGRLLLANTLGVADDYLLLPCIIRTYRDLFRNVGYQVQSEHTFAGVKDQVPIEVLITLFARTDEERTPEAIDGR